MGFSGIPTRGYDEQGNLTWAMCCLCFNDFEPVPARAGGMWTIDPTDGKMVDVCIDCGAVEYLYYANLMNA